jgi:acetyl-CoA carboxylase carboxyl transferase subunit alpha
MTITNPLKFELELVELEKALEQLKNDIASGDIAKSVEYQKLSEKLVKVERDAYSNLTPYNRVQLSRHFDRPFTLDYIELIFENFVELHGDRQFRDDPAIVGGTAIFNGVNVVVVGHQRGRSTEDRIYRNFGMAQPEGYRKALRLFKLAEKFKLPLITLIDTQGAYPGIEAEERGQAEAIAHNLYYLAGMQVPSVGVIIGEGGSGGALALGLTDRVLMLENACYSVITPEGCASILWKDISEEKMGEMVALAADQLQITADKLLKNGLIDGIINEPFGGAHRNFREAAENLKAGIERHLNELLSLDFNQVLEKRYERYRNIGVFTS